MTLWRGREAIRPLCHIAGIALLCGALVPRALAQMTGLKLERVHIGAFDANAWNGIVFDASLRGEAVPFALRIGSKGYGSPAFLDGERIYPAVNVVGAHARMDRTRRSAGNTRRAWPRLRWSGPESTRPRSSVASLLRPTFRSCSRHMDQN
jgi:hypothetical protein